MTINKFRHITKVLDGQASLTKKNIVNGSIKINGSQKAPAGMVVDITDGIVKWDDQKTLGDPGPYEFEFDYEVVDQVDDISAIKETITKIDNTAVTDLELSDMKNLLLLLAARLGYVKYIDGKYIIDILSKES